MQTLPGLPTYFSSIEEMFDWLVDTEGTAINRILTHTLAFDRANGTERFSFIRDDLRSIVYAVCALAPALAEDCRTRSLNAEAARLIGEMLFGEDQP